MNISGKKIVDDRTPNLFVFHVDRMDWLWPRLHNALCCYDSSGHAPKGTILRTADFERTPTGFELKLQFYKPLHPTICGVPLYRTDDMSDFLGPLLALPSEAPGGAATDADEPIVARAT